MNRCKLIAIKPLTGCDIRFRKALKNNALYTFYNNYDFTKEVKGAISAVRNLDDTPDELYDTIDRDKHPIKINVSAIVGKNGSGKSTLMELLYHAAFIMGIDTGIIRTLSNSQKKPLKDPELEDQRKSAVENAKREENFHKTKFKVEFYFELHNRYYKVVFNNGIKVQKTSVIRHKGASLKFGRPSAFKKAHLKELFYSISINYSLFGLNASQTGTWVHHLFHKNDGYQAPLVINPFRDNGTIDINSEFHLAQSRILANLTTQLSDRPVIVNNKTIAEIEFTINPAELNSLNHTSTSIFFEVFNENNKIDIFGVLERLASALIQYKIPGNKLNFLRKRWRMEREKEKNNEEVRTRNLYYKNKSRKFSYNDIYYLFSIYIIKKVFKTVMVYEDYNTSFSKIIKSKDGKREIFSIQDINGLIVAIRKDNSHLTYKIRQALYTLKEGYFKIPWQVERDKSTGYNYCLKANMGFKKFKSLVLKSLKHNEKRRPERITVIPCAFVKPALIVLEIDSPESKAQFHFLSSGELQFAFTLHTIYYHIHNISSVISTRWNRKVKYRNLNLLLDEIELCFHPEFQKKIVKELLQGFVYYNFNSIDSINILFSTHSPFILSDIPSSNILKIKQGAPEPYEPENQTFGANVHDLLANDFFLEDGFIGDFAKEKVDIVVESLRYYKIKRELDGLKSILDINDQQKQMINDLSNDLKKINHSLVAKRQYCEAIIKLVGEPVLKNSLFELYSEAFPKPDFINTQINFLQNLMLRK